MSNRRDRKKWQAQQAAKLLDDAAGAFGNRTAANCAFDAQTRAAYTEKADQCGWQFFLRLGLLVLSDTL